MKKSLIIVAAAVAAASVIADAKPKAPRSEKQMEKEIRELIARMTPEEKVGQLNQLSGFGYDPGMTSQIKAGAVGSILNEVDVATVNRLQRLAVDSTRLHIPLIFARDVIHGFKTIFPIPLGQAATWNEALVEEGARIAADEAYASGVRWTFSPMLDVARDARWGRMAEGFGEDPVLTARLGAAMVKGYQGNDLSAPGSIAACAKHFAAYGASESGRDYNTTWIPEPLLEDVYLPPFKAAADAGAATFMCSFNDINGIPSSGNRHLLRDILRDRWNYSGVMVSDWGSIDQMIPHGYSRDLRQAARQAADAGVDIDMEGYAYISHLKDLMDKGEVSVATVDSLVANVLRLKYRLGLFDNPYVDETLVGTHYAPSSLEAATRCAEEAAVLLKNNGVLPLARTTVGKVALIGPMADAAHDQNGTWCFDMEKDHSVTLRTALEQMLGASKVTYVPGCAYTRDRSTDGFDAALAAAGDADVIIFAGGEEAVLSGEAHSRADISLPGSQTELLRQLKATGKPIVTVLMAGRPLTLMEETSLSDAMLFNFHGGTMAGPAIAHVLFGEVNPSGRLPIGFPKMVGQLPLYYSRKNTGRPAQGITLIDEIPLEAGQTSTGCTSFYLDAGDGPLFPFGYGLSYTDFKYSEPRLSDDTVGKDGVITVECDVTNTGAMEGKETVQLYVRDLVGSYVRPVKELKDFVKVALAPGETRTVRFDLPMSALAYFHPDGQTKVEAGDFQLWVASDAASGSPVGFSVIPDPEGGAAVAAAE